MFCTKKTEDVQDWFCTTDINFRNQNKLKNPKKKKVTNEANLTMNNEESRSRTMENRAYKQLQTTKDGC